MTCFNDALEAKPTKAANFNSDCNIMMGNVFPRTQSTIGQKGMILIVIFQARSWQHETPTLNVLTDDHGPICVGEDYTNGAANNLVSNLGCPSFREGWSSA